MPAKGFTSLTLRSNTYQAAIRIAESEHRSPAKLIEAALDAYQRGGVGGLIEEAKRARFASIEKTLDTLLYDAMPAILDSYVKFASLQPSKDRPAYMKALRASIARIRNRLDAMEADADLNTQIPSNFFS